MSSLGRKQKIVVGLPAGVDRINYRVSWTAAAQAKDWSKVPKNEKANYFGYVDRVWVCSRSCWKLRVLHFHANIFERPSSVPAGVKDVSRQCIRERR